MRNNHRCDLTRQMLVDNTIILAKEQDKTRLIYLEALFIKDLQPTINKQVEIPTLLPSIKQFPYSH